MIGVKVSNTFDREVGKKGWDSTNDWKESWRNLRNFNEKN